MEEIAIERFRESLPDHEQRKAVFQSKAKTMDQAVTAAIDVESWQLSERRRTPPQKARNSREYEDIEEDNYPVRTVGSRDNQVELMTKLEELISKVNVESSAPPQLTPQESSRKCYYCWKPRHLVKNCKKKQHDTRNARQTGNEEQQH